MVARLVLGKDNKVPAALVHLAFLLMLGIGVYSLGDLYMLLYLIFYGVTPGYSYVHDISWYSASLFFAFLAFEMLGERAKGQRRKIIWLVPAFTVGMCIFFLWFWGDWVGNLMAVATRTILMWFAFAGVLELKGEAPIKYKRRVCLWILLFGFVEYATDTMSCFWIGDVIYNPYFWLDSIVSILFVLMPLSLRKAVRQ